MTDPTHLTDPTALGAWLRLLLTPGLGPQTVRPLLARWGSAEAIWAQSPAAWAEQVGARCAQAMAQPPAGWSQQLDDTCAWLQAQPGQRAVLTWDAPGYPEALRHIPDPPILLFAQGRIDLLASTTTPGLNPALAVVGSRNPTPQGQLNAQQFARHLAGAGLCIVSGLALGVDGAAHEGALQAALEDAPRQAQTPLPTVAVVGTGLDRVYPARHRALAHRIAEHGLLLSEYPLGTPPQGANFPRRNRIISGLSLGTLVVEAALGSGSLITARQALEQGREVFALPGSIHSPQSKGCHALIREGACLVESAQDVLAELRLPPTTTPMTAPMTAPTPQPQAAPAGTGAGAPDAGSPGLLALMGHDPVGLDTLLSRSGLGTAELQAALFTLELQGLLERQADGRFQRLVRG